jgi:hypothetical protein
VWPQVAEREAVARLIERDPSAEELWDLATIELVWQEHCR